MAFEDHLIPPTGMEPAPPKSETPTLTRPVMPTNQPGPNPFLRSPLPPSFGVSPDSLRQFYNPATVQNRLVPLSLTANPAIAAVAKTIVEAAAAPADSDPFLHFRGTWLSQGNYAINDVVIWNLSTYVAIQASTGLRPDQNAGSWTLLSENLVFNASASVLQSGGLGPLDKITSSSGNSSTVSIGPLTPSASGEIAILQIVTEVTQATPTTPSGWTLFFTTVAGGDNSTGWFYYQTLQTNPVSVTVSLSASYPWSATLTLFQYGGFPTATITQIAIGANVLTVTCSNNFIAGSQVLLSGLTNAPFLNGASVSVTAATSTQFTAGFTHANYAATADTGTALQVCRQITAQQTGAIGGPSLTLTFASPTAKAGVLAGFLCGAPNINTGLVTSISASDSDSNTYHQTLGSIGPLGFGQPDGSCAFAGYSNRISVFGDTPTITLTDTTNGVANSIGAVAFAVEFPGAPSAFLPYDVVEFRGSMFVCLKQTVNDAFADPTSWALVGPGSGSVDILTANYSAVATDTGRLLSFNSSSATTLTLPNPVSAPPTGIAETGWWIAVQNIGTGTLTISRNGLNIDGVAGNLTLGQNQGLVIFADATGNYETLHGMTSIVLPNIFVNSGVNGSGQVTITLANQNANLVWGGPTSGGAAAPTFRSLVNADLPATVPTVPPGFSVTGNVASPAGAFGLTLTNEPANVVFAGPASGGPAQPTFRRLVSGDIPALPPLAIASAIGTLQTGSTSGVLRLPGNVIPPAGTYRVSVNFFLAANPSAGNLDVNIGWNDGTAARSATNGTLGAPTDISTAALNVANGTIVVESDGVHDVTWAMTLT